MGETKPDFSFLIEILPDLPREYIECAYEQCFEKNIQESIDILLYLNDNYQSSLGKLYKVIKCINNSCTFHDCPFYHSTSERRRDLSKIDYEPKACFNVYTGGIWNNPERCRKGDGCQYAHNSVEMEYHPRHFQVTRRHEEGPKTDFRPNLPAQNTTMQINRFRAEIREMQREIEEKQHKLEEINSEIDELKKLALCMCCQVNFYNFVLPCGHLYCPICKDKINGACFRCNQRVDIQYIVELK